MRILVVEDEIGIANFLKQGLEEEGFEVDIAHHGNKGLDLALSGHYQLLLLDWMLPGKSGLEICEAFRSENKATPIIFLTAKDTISETVEALNTGANDYIKKPFHFEELLARIQVQLREEKESSRILSVGSLRLDPDKHEVKQADKPIDLTQKEFALLQYLLENKNSVCIRKDIIEKVWDIHFDYPTGVIDVFINALRKKLNLHKGNDLIQTVRGVGYIIKDS